MMESEPDKDGELSEATHDTGSDNFLHDSLVEMAWQTNQAEQAETKRLEVFQGLTDPTEGTYEPGQEFRFLVTATVQESPLAVGKGLHQDGQGFRVISELDDSSLNDQEPKPRPVNTSLIDQDHTSTFAGQNGLILRPPEDGTDVIAAQPHDIGSNDLARQSIQYNADALLASTDPDEYNHINIAAGGVQGIFIRQKETGEDLGDAAKNDELREFAKLYGLPEVKIMLKPHEMPAGPPTIEAREANEGNKLWQIRSPDNGVLRVIDIIQFKPGETPLNFTSIDEQGFDLRMQEIDGYGESRPVMDNLDSLLALQSSLAELSVGQSEDMLPAIECTLRRIEQTIIALSSKAQATDIPPVGTLDNGEPRAE